MPPETVSDWLNRIGLPQYAEMFEREQIDLDALPHLTDRDLIGLGLPTGPRVKLLASIAELLRARNGESAYPESGAMPPAIQVPSSRAERRQLTVMFCDLVGSMALSRKLDPETLRDLMMRYQRACGDVIAEYEGHVAQYLGDGLMVYFGWPRAHEDDAERAVLAGLGIVDAVIGLPGPEPLGVRIGIATGPVVVGETGHGDASVPKIAVGETPNLASRLQSLASSNQIIVAPGTRRLLGAAFTYAEMGLQTLKGIADPILPYRIVAAAPSEGRFETARGKSGLTPLVGREEEIDLLLRRWRHASAGQGRVVLLSGQPGIGKSRLIRSLRESIKHEPERLMRFQCSPFHAQTALYPIVDHLERMAGISREDAPEVCLDKVETLLQGTVSEENLPAMAALFGGLLSLPLDRYPAPDEPPQRHKERTLEAFVQYVSGRAAQRPLYIEFEDVHWIDPTTQELLELLVANVARMPALLILTYRPEYRPSWLSEPHVTSLTLNRLDPALGAELALRVIGGAKTFPREVLDEIVEKTDGIPLFVEELTKHVLESGLLRDQGDRYSLVRPLTGVQIPATLRDSLMGRLDRLGAAKELAQVCAVVGREFSHELIAELSVLPQSQLTAALAELVEAQLLLKREVLGETNYVFKHALLQDAAYESVLKSVRQDFHRQVAMLMERRFPSETAARPAFVAHHYTEAGLAEQAVGYWSLAGRNALTRSANIEAISHFNKAIELLEQLPVSESRLRRELDLWLGLSPAYIATRGFSTSEVERAALRARELCEKLGEVDGAAYAIISKFVVHLVRAELDQGLNEAEAGLALSRKINDSQLEALFNFLIGDVHYWAGRFDTALSCLERALVPWNTPEARTVTERSGVNAYCIGLAYIAHVQLMHGFPDRAKSTMEQSVRTALELGHGQTAGHCLGLAGWMAVFGRDLTAARQMADLTIEYCHEQRLMFWEASGYLVDGWALIQEGRRTEGVARMQDGFAIRRSAGAHLVHSSFYPVLAECHLHANELAAAERLLTDGFNHIERTGERHSEAELHRVQAQLMLRAGRDAEEAMASFRRGVHIARAQGAVLFELRATRELARLRLQQNGRGEALQLLNPVVARFTEGFGTEDLKDAYALLETMQT